MEHFVLKKSLLLLAFSAGVQDFCLAADHQESVEGLYSSLDRSPKKTIRLSCQTQVTGVLSLLSEGNDLILQAKNSPYGNPYKAAARLSWERTLPVGERVSLDEAFPVFEALKSAVGDIPTPSFVTFEYSPDNGMTFYDCDCDDRPGEAFKINLSSGWKKLDSIRFDIGRSDFDPETSSVHVSIAGFKYGDHTQPLDRATTGGSPVLQKKPRPSVTES